MLAWLVFRWKLFWARKARNDYDRKVNKEWLAWVKKDPKNADKEEHFGLASQEYFALDEEIDKLVSDYWLSKADSVVVPKPSHKDEAKWQDTAFGGRILSDAGVFSLRKTIWEVERERDSLYHPKLTMVFAAVAALYAFVQGMAKFLNWLKSFL